MSAIKKKMSRTEITGTTRISSVGLRHISIANFPLITTQSLTITEYLWKNFSITLWQHLVFKIKSNVSLK